MTEKTFEDLLGEAVAQAKAGAPPAANAVPQGQNMDPTLFDSLLKDAVSSAQSDQQQQPAAPPGTAPPSASQPGSPPSQPPQPSQPPSPTPQALNPLGHINEAIESIGGGAGQSVLETKDFLFGEPSEADKSQWRKDFEATNRQLVADSPVNGFIMGVSQFATGLIGAGKLLAGAKLAVPALGAVEGAIAAAPKAVQWGAEATKAAAVGSIVFDPHDARLSNLVESFPALSNPITRWLAADPNDTAAEGRLKSAIESIGLDAALGAVLLGATKAYKALASGDHTAAEAAARETEAAMAARSAEPRMASPAEVDALNAKIAAEVQAGTFGKDPNAAPAEAVQPASGSPEASAPPKPEGAPAAPESPQSPTFTAVPNATEAAAQEGVKLPPKLKLPEITDQQTEAILKGLRSDAEAIEKAGSWQGAIADGHTFGRGDGVSWQKMDPMDDPSGATTKFTSRVVDAIEKEISTAKGGDVLSDPRVTQMVQQRANLFGEDPAALLGMIQQSGKAASRMVADMEAGYLVSQRAFQDSFTMASRINAGALDEWGGDLTKALDALKSQVSMAASAYSGARSITANAGRAMRRMRSEFRLRPEDIQALTEVDGERLAQLIANTNGDPQALAKIAAPSTWKRIADWSNFLLVNNLLWGWKTHLVNLTTNGYMLAARPAERIVGSFAVEGGQSIRAEAMRQYLYMGAALGDSFRAAKEAFVLGDSRLAPHQSEPARVGLQDVGVNALNFKPWGSLPNLIHNVLTVATPKNVLGLPTRALGFADEAMKQITYRSKVMAAAAVDGSQRGLGGRELRDYVKQRLSAAFDEHGVGTDAAAKREAMVATFQQDLLPRTFGKVVQDATAQLPALKIVLPFVKTPTNVMRYGWKMSPGLNLLQSEYRQMITGKLGKEAQAQAVGQMGLGTLLMGSMAYHVAQGMVTGGGPSDPKLWAQLLATGWQPYSYVVRNADGSKTYVPYGKFDPIAMPLGIVADLADAIHLANETGDGDLMGRIEQGTMALLVSLTRQMASKSYLMNVGNLLDAIDQPDQRGAAFVGGVAANMVPAASALRWVNPDPYLREARGVVDKVMATVPGFSEMLPARYDAWGQPIASRRGLTSTMESDLVDLEVERMGLEGGHGFLPPSSKIGPNVDLRDITMKDGRNAYAAYQQLAARPSPRALPLKMAVAKAIQSKVYAKAPDGPADIKGTKMWLLSGIVMRYRNGALAFIKADRNVRDALLKDRLKVSAAYAAKQSDPAGVKAKAGGLQAIGDAFGVDLSGLGK